MNKTLFLLVAIVLVFIAIYSLSSSNSSSLNPTKKISMMTTACTHKDTFDSFTKVMQSGNQLSLLQSGECVMLMDNEKVTVLEEGTPLSKVSQDGREFYVNTAFLQ